MAKNYCLYAFMDFYNSHKGRRGSSRSPKQVNAALMGPTGEGPHEGPGMNLFWASDYNQSTGAEARGGAKRWPTKTYFLYIHFTKPTRINNSAIIILGTQLIQATVIYASRGRSPSILYQPSHKTIIRRLMAASVSA